MDDARRTYLESLKRPTLQALCKEHNLRAVGKNAELIDRLLEAGNIALDTTTTSDEQPTTMDMSPPNNNNSSQQYDYTARTPQSPASVYALPTSPTSPTPPLEQDTKQPTSRTPSAVDIDVAQAVEPDSPTPRARVPHSTTTTTPGINTKFSFETHFGSAAAAAATAASVGEDVRPLEKRLDDLKLSESANATPSTLKPQVSQDDFTFTFQHISPPSVALHPPNVVDPTQSPSRTSPIFVNPASPPPPRGDAMSEVMQEMAKRVESELQRPDRTPTTLTTARSTATTPTAQSKRPGRLFDAVHEKRFQRMEGLDQHYAARRQAAAAASTTAATPPAMKRRMSTADPTAAATTRPASANKVQKARSGADVKTPPAPQRFKFGSTLRKPNTIRGPTAVSSASDTPSTARPASPALRNHTVPKKPSVTAAVTPSPASAAARPRAKFDLQASLARGVTGNYKPYTGRLNK
ncbi:hypothetical protein RI367_006691 [Sorochytrium milnesiophthora]